MSSFAVRSMKVFLALMLAGGLVSGCSPRSFEESTPSHQDPVLRERAEKDRDFRFNPNSPVGVKDRARFQGLAYFDINPGLRLRVQLNRYPAPQQVRLGTNTGEVRSGLRYGFFEFQVEGKTCRLQVYRLEDTLSGGGSGLFIPFRDATTGQETYAAGRYIDLKENTTGYYDLDFNRAYNPYCAYEKTFSCPVPPAENTLAVPIRAGRENLSARKR